MRLDELTDYLDEYLRVAAVPDYGPALNGLQVANSGRVERLAVAVDGVQATIDGAVAAGADLLLVHHGLFWDGNQPVTGRRYRRLKALLDADVAVYSAHLPLDVHPEVGNNAVLARALGIEPKGTLGEYKGQPVGVWGELDVRREALAARLDETLGSRVTMVAGGPERVRKVGVITGGAASELPAARAAGLDALRDGRGGAPPLLRRRGGRDQPLPGRALRHGGVGGEGAGAAPGGALRAAVELPRAPDGVVAMAWISAAGARAVARHLAAVVALGLTASPARGQAEVEAWGEVPGIRVEGELMEVGAGLCAVSPEGRVIARTGKERQRPKYSREGSRRTVLSTLGPLSFVETVEDAGPGAATLDVRFTADTTTTAGGYLCLELPRAAYPDARVALRTSRSGRTFRVPVASATGEQSEPLRAMATGVSVLSARRRLELSFDSPAEVVVSGGGPAAEALRVRVPVLTGASGKGATSERRFSLRVTGEVDRAPVTLALDATRPGRAFAGLGGNFRIQNPALDPKVVHYNLSHLRVAWGRVELPWRAWQPEEGVDPVAAAEAGRLDPRVERAMEMARTLAARGVPFVLSAWFPPPWAIVAGPPPRGKMGNELDPARTREIYASIAGYLLYLKRHYGAEPALLSFNESDLGIDVLQTPEEHDALIRGLGAYLAERGLATRMLLGDVSDATPTEFILSALDDPAARPYIGAVSFHSWRGWSDEQLTFWADAARKLNVPLLVGEGSTDAGAWRYPAIFSEPAFALQEIELYTRILALTQPLSILQWQLTSDYSVLTGGGIFGDSSVMRPTQRFWNLKQLASTPEGAFWLPITCGAAHVTCAAFGNIARGEYAVHVVNRGASRSATLTGLPAEVRELHVYVTDAERGMEEGKPVPVVGGRAVVPLAAGSFTTVIGYQSSVIGPRTALRANAPD